MSSIGFWRLVSSASFTALFLGLSDLLLLGVSLADESLFAAIPELFSVLVLDPLVVVLLAALLFLLLMGSTLAGPLGTPPDVPARDPGSAR